MVLVQFREFKTLTVNPFRFTCGFEGNFVPAYADDKMCNPYRVSQNFL